MQLPMIPIVFLQDERYVEVCYVRREKQRATQYLRLIFKNGQRHISRQ